MLANALTFLHYALLQFAMFFVKVNFNNGNTVGLSYLTYLATINAVCPYRLCVGDEGATVLQGLTR